MDKTVFVILVLTGFCVPSASSANVNYFVSKEMTWFDAQEYCISHHTNLAEILSKESLTTMMNTAAGGYKHKAWIGLSKTLSLTWVDKEKVRHFNWDNGEPTAIAMEICVCLTRDGHWRAHNCSALKNPLCIQGGTYQFGSPKLNWTDAITYCKELQATLATFPEKNYVISEWQVEAEEVWIGLSGLLQWSWSETGKDLTFMNWTHNEISDLTGEENCAALELQNVTWTDEQCSATYPFYCYGINKSWKTVVRMKIRSTANMEDPAIIADLQQQLHAVFAQGGFEVKLTWTKLPVKGTND